MNKRLKEHAKSNEMVYLDYYSSMVDDRPGLKNEYSPDGVHPNKEGYEVMSELAEKALSLL